MQLVKRRLRDRRRTQEDRVCPVVVVTHFTLSCRSRDTSDGSCGTGRLQQGVDGQSATVAHLTIKYAGRLVLLLVLVLLCLHVWRCLRVVLLLKPSMNGGLGRPTRSTRGDNHTKCGTAAYRGLST